MMKTSLPIKFVPKGWGFEKWIVNCDKYCGKLLYFVKGKKCSWHYHKIKDEVFYIHSGKIMVLYSEHDDIQNAKKNFKQKLLDYHDKRLSKIAEGYLLQAIFYYMTGDAFCNNLDCRLNNAHWQKDLLYSQLKIGKLCDKHQALLDN